LIKQLISNELLATNGEFKWDGTRDSGVKATLGNYIVLFEAFSLSSGEKFTKTKVVIVAGIL
jgi:flagellar hook assembly protein FlgD